MRISRAIPLGVLVTLIAVLALFGPLAGLALAQTYPPTTPPTTPPTSPPVAGETVIPTGVAPGVEEAPGVQPAEEAEAAALAFTGAELTLLVAAFGILLAGGAVALIAARRRGRPETG